MLSLQLLRLAQITALNFVLQSPNYLTFCHACLRGIANTARPKEILSFQICSSSMDSIYLLAPVPFFPSHLMSNAYQVLSHPPSTYNPRLMFLSISVTAIFIHNPASHHLDYCNKPLHHFFCLPSLLNIVIFHSPTTVIC